MTGAVPIGLPQRLSVRRGDPHFHADSLKLSDSIDVYLDGRLLGEIASYDVVSGEVTRLRRNVNGCAIRDERGELQFERLTGEVVVRWSEVPAA